MVLGTDIGGAGMCENVYVFLLIVTETFQHVGLLDACMCHIIISVTQ